MTTVIATDLVAKRFGDLNPGEKFLRLTMLRNTGGPFVLEKHAEFPDRITTCRSAWPVKGTNHFKAKVLDSELVIPVR